MAAVTAQQVLAAFAAGRDAAMALSDPDSNPHAQHVPVWRRRGQQSAPTGGRFQGSARALSLAWRQGYLQGQADYGRGRGLPAPSTG